VIDESLFIESIENMRERSPDPAPALAVVPDVIASPAAPRETLPKPVLMEPLPVEPALPEPVVMVEDPALPETGPLPKAPAAQKAAAAPGSAGRKFSIPVIGELEKGQYYLQLGAYSKPEVLESSVGKLDSRYPLSVQTAGSPEKPIYRLLLGPVNLGESGALLQRFKGSGYSDAFVRTY
jgi:cell division protein FtsN